MQDAPQPPIQLRPSSQPDYDAVVVGTSPICLLTALVEESRGKRVLMVDASPAVGGTWKTTRLLGFSNVELGCHGIDADRGVYRLLDDLGVDMQVLEPQPCVFSAGPRFFPKRVTFRHRWLRDLYDVLTGTKNFDLPGSERGRLRAVATSLKRVGRYAITGIRGTNHPAKYPPHGAIELVTRLQALALAAGIEIRTGASIDEVVLDRRAATVCLRIDGETLTAGRVHLTSSSHLQLSDGNEVIDLHSGANTWQSLYLVLRDCEAPSFTYIVFSEAGMLHRASDLTRFAIASPGNEDARLVALTIDEHVPEAEATARTALQRLKSLGLISETARLDGFAFLPYHFSRIDFGSRKQLQRALDPLVHIVESDTLTRSIKVLLRENDVAPMVARVKVLRANRLGHDNALMDEALVAAGGGR